MDTSDEWISVRTGIKERHILQSEETCSGMSVNAAKAALEDAGVLPEDIDYLICATVHGDYFTPSLACCVQKKLGLQCAGIDVNAACAGFLYALDFAQCMIKTKKNIQRILVIATEGMSRLVDWSDRNTCVLFGDGSGAAAVGRDDAGIVDLVMFSDGRGGDVLQLKSGGTMTMAGREVFEFAVRKVPESIRTLLERARMGADEVDHYLLHQANARIIQTVAKRLKVSVDKFPVNLDHCGNTSAASIPVLIDEMNREGRLLRGEKVVLSGFGAGLTWGAVLLIW